MARFGRQLQLTIFFNNLPSAFFFINQPINLKPISNIHHNLQTRTAIMFRSAITRQARLFSTQAPLRKSVLDTAKETLQSANKAVGETLAKGIDSAGKSSSIGALRNAFSSSVTVHRPRRPSLALHPHSTKNTLVNTSQSPQQPQMTLRLRPTSLQVPLRAVRRR